jgi:uncharacterized SAM-binding protein YcdF (DUF218 family)
VAALAIVILALTPLVGYGLSRAGTALVVSVPVGLPDAIVSLASHDRERLPTAAALARLAPAATVILTVPAHVTPANCDDCPHRLALLVRRGIPPGRVHVVQVRVDGTYGEATACRDFVVQSGVRRLLVVTSPYHTRRALATFRSVFAGTNVAVGVVPAAQSPAQPDRWWAARYDRWYVRYEWVATLYYIGRHGISPALFAAGALPPPHAR